jgi:hypothetical protein
MTYNPRLPTDTVVIVGTFNKKWLIQFQNRKKHQREFLRDLLSFGEVVFDTLQEAMEIAEGYKLQVVDVKLHPCYKQHEQVDSEMQDKIAKMRANFDGTYAKKIA